ncbi:MAG TPA: hypothetical protein VFF73_36155 [Planctomycetota bacterium]|nr:hypothetical protein [Planctomycetota bacterium]
MNVLERTFLDMAIREKKLSVEQRDQIEAACARASGEGQILRPWRAAFVRGFLSRGDVDAILHAASAKVENESDEDTGHEARELSASAEDEGLDFRLGVLAIQSGVLDQEQLETALSAQRRHRSSEKQTRPLDRILVDEGLVAPSVMEGILLLQERLRQQHNKESSATQAIAADLRFGQVALDARLVDEKALKRALISQKKAPGAKQPSLGDLLVEQGAMTREARDLVLELQEKRSSRPVTAPPASRASAEEADRIGRLLVENRLVDEEQVKGALTLQRELRAKGIDRRLGDLLVLQGVIDRGTLETVLRTQTVRRKAPVTRRRALLREDMLPEHPLTLALAVAVAVILSSAYVAASGGTRLIMEAVLALQDREQEKK